MKNIQRNILFIILMVVALTVNAVHANPMSMKKSVLDLTILHNNDMHARFEQTDKYSSHCHPDEAIANKCYGGFARVSEVVKDYRHAAENGGPSVLYLNAGDTYAGTPWFTIFKDKIVSDFLNILKPDACSLGNHEFDLGVAGLIPFLNDVTFPVLVANLNNSRDHAIFQTRSIKKSVVFDVKGYKIGVIGYLTPGTKQTSLSNELEFIPEVDGINKEAQKLKETGVNIIVALGHSGYAVDREIAEKCPLVDAVIGGHTHSFLYTGDQPDSEQINGPYPTVVVQDTGKAVPVVQAYANTKYLGKLELSFDEDGNLVHWGGHPILLNGSIASDPVVLELLKEYRPAVKTFTETSIGMTKVHIEGYACRAVECNLGNMISDAMVYTRAKDFVGERWTDAPIAIVQSGDIRTSIRVGNITKYALKLSFPYDNSMFVMNVTGHILKKALEHSVKLYTGGRGEFLQMSGLRVAYDLSRSPGDRVTSVDVLCSDCDVPKYERFDMNRVYGMILSSYLYKGGDGFDMFKGKLAEAMSIKQFDAIEEYVKAMGIVYPMIEGRITISGGQKNGSYHHQ